MHCAVILKIQQKGREFDMGVINKKEKVLLRRNLIVLVLAQVVLRALQISPA